VGTVRIARSWTSSIVITVACVSSPSSPKETETDRAPSTTWALVTTSPSATITPEPCPSTCIVPNMAGWVETVRTDTTASMASAITEVRSVASTVAPVATSTASVVALRTAAAPSARAVPALERPSRNPPPARHRARAIARTTASTRQGLSSEGISRSCPNVIPLTSVGVLRRIRR